VPSAAAPFCTSAGFTSEGLGVGALAAGGLIGVGADTADTFIGTILFDASDTGAIEANDV
jgi:hypothetical protein